MRTTAIDEVLINFDRALRVITGHAAASRPNPAERLHEEHEVALNEQEQKHSAGLMRVNHVGEVCAQALYQAQGQFSPSTQIREQFSNAAREEEDHLAWTAERLKELNSHTSFLNPLWYAGSYALGAVAARFGDSASLGFVVETERQVEAHLSSHLGLLPEHDQKSRVIVEQMRQDEIEHGASAQNLGAQELPLPVKTAMKVMAKIMTTTAYYV